MYLGKNCLKNKHLKNYRNIDFIYICIFLACQVSNCLECSETGLKCKPDKCEEGYRRVSDGTCKSTGKI